MADNIQDLLKAELAGVQAANQRSMGIAAVMVLVIGGYLSWVHSQVNTLLNPEGIALAATGLAIEAVPQGGEYLHATVVDGAPDIARAASQGVLDMLPAYRSLLEEELSPVIDEVCSILATTAVDSIANSSTDAQNEAFVQQAALQEGTDAVFVRVGALLDEAMDTPTMHEDIEEPSPRETINEALDGLKSVDRGLKQIAAGGGSAAERELLLTWMALLTQYQDDAEIAAIEAYENQGAVEE